MGGYDYVISHGCRNRGRLRAGAFGSGPFVAGKGKAKERGKEAVAYGRGVSVCLFAGVNCNSDRNTCVISAAL